MGVVSPARQSSILVDRAGATIDCLNGFVTRSSGAEESATPTHQAAGWPIGRTHAPAPRKGEEGEAESADADEASQEIPFRADTRQELIGQGV